MKLINVFRKALVHVIFNNSIRTLSRSKNIKEVRSIIRIPDEISNSLNFAKLDVFKLVPISREEAIRSVHGILVVKSFSDRESHFTDDYYYRRNDEHFSEDTPQRSSKDDLDFDNDDLNFFKKRKTQSVEVSSEKCEAGSDDVDNGVNGDIDDLWEKMNADFQKDIMSQSEAFKKEIESYAPRSIDEVNSSPQIEFEKNIEAERLGDSKYSSFETSRDDSFSNADGDGFSDGGDFD